MARRYFEGKGVEADPVAAVGWLMRGSRAGSTEAMILLGQRFEMGDLMGKDINRAGQLYSTAAKLNDPVGGYHLAMLYLNGTGTKPDPVRAYVCYSMMRQENRTPRRPSSWKSYRKRFPKNRLLSLA